ncbi:alpha-hydroxy acid oxidase [Nakamurella flava]|uniref:alpha-hydroxy acid oxidase n=1 Tax=Nakamurella flava TaxID=2576308 RepID=UPI001F0D22B3|nr:alpha-hydroxy acid oxidase [Nakamurella flava]
MLPVLAEHLATARSVLSSAVFEYYDSGAGAELTRHEAAQAWDSFRLRPWPLRDVGQVDTSVDLFGHRYATPIAVAPSAFHQLASVDAEPATGSGAAAARALFVLSTRSSVPVAAFGAHMGALDAPWWFQVYVMQRRDVTMRIVEAAVDAGARALVLTGDTPYVGRKRKVAGVRISMPDDEYLVNVRPYLPADIRSDNVAARAAAAQDPSITLETIDWLTRATGLPVLVKGVLRGDAAQDCVQAGAAGIVVSNHAGRQLDRAVPSALALAEVVAAVGDQVPVLVDGGITSGLDVLVALALGARAVMIGRPALWALAADGATGVTAALDALTDDLRHSLALAGLTRADAVPPDLVVRA